MKLYLASVGAGKTEIALQTITNTLNAHPFARVWVLLATRRQQDNFRQRLVEYGHSVVFNVEFFDFYELYRRLLNAAGVPARSLEDGARGGLLRAVIKSLKDSGNLEVYSGIAETSGFVRIAGNLIIELKQNRVYPDEYRRAVRTPKDRDLWRIYSSYQQELQNHALVDRDGEGWLALETVSRRPDLLRDVELLIADGFDQFTPVQADLLALLGERVAQTLVTLTTVPQREETIGRRFEDAYQTLVSRSPYAEVERLNSSPNRQPDLQHLVENVFLATTPKLKANAVRFIEAPDAAAEVGAVLRRVKRLLLEGCSPDDVLIALRDWQRYLPHFLALRQVYHLPLVLHSGESLEHNPFITTVLQLMALHETGFARRDLLDVLRSPYIRAPGLDKSQVDLLENISQRYTIIRGRDLWLSAIAQAAHPGPARTEDDETLDEPFASSDAAPTESAFLRLQAALAQFFDRVTPSLRDTIENYVLWLERLIGADPQQHHDPQADDEPLVSVPEYTLDMLAALRDVDDRDLIARDLIAAQILKRELRGMVSTDELLSGLRQRTPDLTDWGKFRLELYGQISAAQVNPRPVRSGRVLVTTASDARGLPHAHVFILGLAEGIFPARAAEDPLYLDSERLRLSADGVLLKTQADRATDDGLFYELICLPRETLTLSRPTAQDGQPWHASHLWRAVLQCFSDVPLLRFRAGEAVHAEEAAALHELALTVSDGLNAERISAIPYYNWLVRHQTSFWRAIQSGRSIEARRLSRLPHDHYSGRIRDPRLLQHVNTILHPNRRWSATQFNDYGVCGFRFFAKRLLNLEALEEPEEGIDVLKRGSINHRILELTYRAILEQGMPIEPQYTAHALELLHQAARDVLRSAPDVYGFRPTALWHKEQRTIAERLARLVETDFSAENPIRQQFGGAARQPFMLEAPFGGTGGDGSATPSPDVWITLGDAGQVRAGGLIDRIDRIGDSAIVIDYKSGSKAFTLKDMAAGRNFQMIVYLLAAEIILRRSGAANAPADVLGGLFWHMRSGKVSGTLKRDSEVITQGLEQLGAYLQRMRSGDFAVQPNGTDKTRCVTYCEFQPLCRLCGLNLIKA